MDIVDSRRAPRLVQAFLGPAFIEAADRAAEEGTGFAPPLADHRAGGGQAGANVQLPQRPRRAARQAELEARDRSACANRARKLPQRRHGIVDVAQEIGEREPVELAVCERQPHRTRLYELDAAVRTTPRLGEHARALVDA